MKKILLYTFLGFIFSMCGANKQQMQFPEKYTFSKKIGEYKDEDFVVKKKISIEEGKKISLKKDDIGKNYLVKEPGNKVVISIEVYRNLENPLPDSGVQYSLIFELDNPVKPGKWVDSDLKKIQAVYGFHAFHPKSGYYPVESGSIAVKTKKGKQMIIEVRLPDRYSEELNGEFKVDLPEIKK